MKPLNSLFYPSTLSFLLLFIALPGIQTVAAGSAGTGNALANYKLQPMDLLKVQVFQELDMDREVRVSKDFIVVLPLIESVDLKNRTVREAELLITDLYKKDYLVNPQINVTVMEYAQRTLTVLGAVNSPGTVVIPPEKDLTLIEAIARAGGFSRLANRSRVGLTRTLSNGQTKNESINADQQMVDGSNRAVMQTGDVLYVPERVL